MDVPAPPPSPTRDLLLRNDPVAPECRTEKHPLSRHPSPISKRPKVSTIAGIEKQLHRVHMTDVDDVFNMDKPLAAIDNAEELMTQKAIDDEDYNEQVRKLRLLKPGEQIMNFEVGMGFRVPDGYKLHYDIDSILVSKSRDASYDKEKIWTYVAKWPRGFSWMYWSNATFGEEKLQLGECAIRFGMGIFHKPGRCQTKEIFLDSRMTSENSFVIAIVLDGERQSMSRQKEQNAEVYRVWRSEVPQSIKQTIQLRELINIRQGSAHVRWWEL